jgi:hypothetical protein
MKIDTAKSAWNRELIFDFRENIARYRNGDWSKDVTEIIAQPSDEAFEARIAFLRAARLLGGLGDGSLDHNAKKFGHRLYFCLFSGVLVVSGVSLALLFNSKRLFRRVQQPIDRARFKR